MKPRLSLILALAQLLHQTLAYPRPADVVRRQYDVATPYTQQTNTLIPKVTDMNTLNTTVPPPAQSNNVYPTAIAGGQLQLSITNNFLSSRSLNAYITGLDANNRLVMVQANGQFYYPTGNSTIPIPLGSDTSIPLGAQGSTTTLYLPGWISAGRIWISEGTLLFYVVESQPGTWSLVEPSVIASNDPNVNTNFGFVELTNSASLGLFVNLSFVDFIGLALGMSVTSGTTSTGPSTSTDSTTQTIGGLSPTASEQICSDLQTQAALDAQPWDKLCVYDSSGSLMRILSPGDYISTNPSAFSSYWSTYIASVWGYYAYNTLTINSQNAVGDILCTAINDELVCDGSSRTYSQPTASDIFTCNTGPFAISSNDNDVHRAIVPRLCAAINRSTLLLDGGNVQPGVTYDKYYTVSPTNYYAKFVHEYEAGGVGYAFSYDDVAPDGGVDQSGLVWSTEPEVLTVVVNG